MTHRHLFLAVAVTTMLVVPAKADLFSVTGTVNGLPVSGSADFAINPGTQTLTITLTNTLQSTLVGISQTLVGVTWAGGPTGLTTGSNPWVVPTGIIDCVTSTNKVSHCLPGTGTSPYDWGLNAASGPGGVAVTQPNLFAGSGSGKPFGIVTTNIDGSKDGLRNAQHNPYLVGPVTFTLKYTGGGTAPVGGVNLYFGTSGDHVPSTVPDGGVTVALLGGTLLALEALRRRLRA